MKETLELIKKAYEAGLLEGTERAEKDLARYTVSDFLYYRDVCMKRYYPEQVND